MISQSESEQDFYAWWARRHSTKETSALLAELKEAKDKGEKPPMTTTFKK